MNREARMARDLATLNAGRSYLYQVFVKPSGLGLGDQLEERGWSYRSRIDGRGTHQRVLWLSKTGGQAVALAAWDEALEAGLHVFKIRPGYDFLHEDPEHIGDGFRLVLEC